MTKPLSVGLALLVLGCVGKVVIDPSPQAVEANDFTMMVSACETVPGRGMDVCRVTEGSPIESVWRLVVPVADNVFETGELTVYYKGVQKTFALTKPLIEIPWNDVVQDPDHTWKSAHDGEALALAEIRWKTPTGVEEIWRARGIAKIVVTKPGYSVLPMDSGFATWGTTCKIQYTSAGRSAISCK